MARTVRTLCGICCYHMIDVEVEGDKVTKISASPIAENKGDGICKKATESLPWNYREGRVIHPMVRKEKGGPWERVSWDDALDTIATKLNELRRNYGPEALWIYEGSGGALAGALTLHAIGNFGREFGTPNIGGFAENCYVPRLVCNRISCGALLTPDLDPKANPGSIFVWGSNPTAALPPLSARILRFKREKGTKIVVVDPRRIPLAKRADIHLQLSPGTDAALALAMMNTIIEEEIYDKEFVEKYTSGFDKLVEHVAQYKPEYVEGIVGVPASLIKEAARMFAKSKPAAVVRFLGGTETTSNGFEGHRAIDVLSAITGNIDNEGGNIIPEPSTGYLLGSALKWIRTPIGADYHPVFTRVGRTAVGACIADSVLNSDPYPIRGMIIAGANPALMHVNSSRMREALRKLDFVIQLDLRFNDTSEFADIFLPAQATLEKEEVGSGWGFYDNDMLGVIERVLPPPEECLPDYEIWWRMSEKLGFEVPKSFEDACNSSLLAPIGLTLKDLREKPYYYRKEFEKYKKKGFDTPSGKFEIYSTYLEKLGFYPLPSYVEPAESPTRLPSLALKYPLTAINFRVAEFYHTRFREIPNLRKLNPEPEVEINPSDAEKYGIANGDTVLVESVRGGIKLKANVTGDIKEGVVGMLIGWSDPANCNFLTGDDVHERDPVTGSGMLRAFLCRISKTEV